MQTEIENGQECVESQLLNGFAEKQRNAEGNKGG